MYSPLYNHLIVCDSCANLRRQGRKALAGKWSLAVVAVLIYLALTEVPIYFMDYFLGKPITISAPLGSYYSNLYSYSDLAFGNFSWASSLYSLLLTGAFMYGLVLFFMSLFRRRTASNEMLFEGFSDFGKTLGLYLYMLLFIFLWSLLFVIPGIIAAIRYSQSFMILADDPSKSITQCVNESKFIMEGNKSKYFWMNLSFIGWILLAAIPPAIVGSIMQNTGSQQIVMDIVSWAASAGELWVISYILSTDIAFYDILTGRLTDTTNQDSNKNYYEGTVNGYKEEPDKDDYTGKRGSF